LFFNCKNDTTTESANSEVKVSSTAAALNQKVNENAYQIKKHSWEELDEWLPENILDYVKMNPSYKGEKDFNHVEANYHYKGSYDHYITIELANGNSEKELKVKKSIAQKIQMNFAEDTEDGYTKVYNRNGMDVFEMQSNYKNSATIEFIVNQRFYVRVRGTNLKAAEVWQILDQLDFNQIK